MQDRNTVGTVPMAAKTTPSMNPQKRGEDESYMRQALLLARFGAAAIGCVIVRNGRIIGSGQNEVDLRNDTTAHAEMVAIRLALFPPRRQPAARPANQSMNSTIDASGALTSRPAELT